MDLALDINPADAAGAMSPSANDPSRASSPAALRGPMRPETLASTRQRTSGVRLTRKFRWMDIALLATLVPLALQAGLHGVLSAPIGAAVGPIVGACSALWALKAMGAYAFAPHETLWRQAAKAGGACGVGGAAAVLIAWLVNGGAEIAAFWTALAFVGVNALHAADWITVRRLRKTGRLTPNVVVVGATANASRLIEAALKTGDAAILGVFDDRMSRIPSEIHGVRVLGDTKSLLSHKLLPFIDRIIITVTPSAQTRVRELIDKLKYLPNAVTLFMDVEGVDAQRAALSRLAHAPLTQVSGVREDDARADAKRLQDMVLGGLGVIVAMPIMLLTALAVRLDSPGPIFFRQRRHGFNNETINVWKFRSMRHEAADAHAARQVSTNDDRVTRVGHIIRKLSLDELPQLINVVKGEMSLVGPRPHAIGMKTAGEDSHQLVAEYAWRHRMKPGLTGWAQVNGSVGAVDTPELVRRRVSLDIEYIERQSFWFDLWIMAITIPSLIGNKTAVR